MASQGTQRPGRGRKKSNPSLSSSQSQAKDPVADGEEEFSQSTGASRKCYDQMGSALQHQKAMALVRYLLCYQGKKTPVKRKELLDKVLGEHKRAFPEILERANEHLRSVFGLEAKEIYKTGTKVGAMTATAIASSKSYVLVSLLDPEKTAEFVQRPELDRAEMGLLCVILSLIMMKQGGISEDQLWNCLNRMHINADSRHDTFGDVKRLIHTDFVSQMYLEKEKVVAGDKQSFTFRWGPRATAEIDKEEMLSFVAEIYDVDVQQWKRQFGDLLK